MAEPPPTFSTLAAELQVMILTKVFERAVITVKYPYQTIREIEYENMELQGNLRIFFVSKGFYEAAKIALFTTAKFHHDDFYLGKGQRKSRRLQNSAPKAFRQFRHVTGFPDFAAQFLHACQNDRWPYEDLRSITITRCNGVHLIVSDFGPALQEFRKVRDSVSKYGVKVRYLFSSTLYTYCSDGLLYDAITKVIVEDDRCWLYEAQRLPLASYEELRSEFKSILGEATVLPVMEADQDGKIRYTSEDLDWF